MPDNHLPPSANTAKLIRCDRSIFVTNAIAIFLGIVIVAFFGLDFTLLEGENSLFLAKKFMEFTEWMAFWR